MPQPTLRDTIRVSIREPAPSVTSVPGLPHHIADSSTGELVIRASVRMNSLLLAGKAIASYLSSSPAILTSLVDSAVDVMVQGSLFWASRAARRGATSAMYPAGRGQLEPLAVVVCAALKVAGMVAVALEAADVLHDGASRREWRERHGLQHIWRHHFESVMLFAMLSLIKLAFCTWCELVVHADRGTITTETARAVLADNKVDVLLSVGALVATVVTELAPSLWWVDPAVALLLALLIFGVWMRTGRQQVDLIVGRAAEPSFLDMVRDIAEAHDPRTSLDTVRAYHFGPRFLVELELVMDEHTELRESHDCGILLQHKIEALPRVERCFVHIDYQSRDDDDHDHKTPVARKMHASLRPPVAAGMLDDLQDQEVVDDAEPLLINCEKGGVGLWIAKSTA